MAREHPVEFESLKNQRILVTGSSGFIGSHLMELATSLGLSRNFLAIDKVNPTQTSEVQFQRIDCKNYREIKSTFVNFKPTIVIHLAARTDLNGKSLAEYDDNILGSANIQKCAENIKIIAASSRLVFDPHKPEPDNPFDYSPTSWYGESKVQMETRLNESPNTIIVRPTSIWGPRCGPPFEGLVKNILRGTYLQVRNTQVVKTLGYVKNTGYQLLKLASFLDQISSPVNLGDGNYDLIDFSNRLAAELGVRTPKLVSYSTLREISKAGSYLNRIGIKAPLNLTRFENIYQSQIYSLELIKSIVPLLPYKFDQAMKEFAEWGRK